MVLVPLVCRSVCLSVSNITQKLWMDCNEILWKGFGKVAGTSDFDCSSNYHADCPIEIPAITWQIMSGCWWNFLDSSAMIQGTIDYIFEVICITMRTPNRESGQYGDNELPWLGRGLRFPSALVCFHFFVKQNLNCLFYLINFSSHSTISPSSKQTVVSTAIHSHILHCKGTYVIVCSASQKLQ